MLEHQGHICVALAPQHKSQESRGGEEGKGGHGECEEAEEPQDMG